MRSTRFRFWWQMMAIALIKPRLFYDYMTVLGLGEHFFNYRHEVKAQLLQQLETIDRPKQQKVLEPVSIV